MNVEDCALLGYYAASSGDFFTKASGKPSVPFSDFKNPWITTTRCVITEKRAVLRKYPFRILPETPIILQLLQFFSITLDVEEGSALQ